MAAVGTSCTGRCILRVDGAVNGLGNFWSRHDNRGNDACVDRGDGCVQRKIVHAHSTNCVGWPCDAAGVLFSYLAVKRNWDFAISIEGHWNGIYFNRNSLAPVAAVGLLAAVSILLITVTRRRNNWWPATAIVLADIAVLDGYVLMRTRSSTSIGAIAVFVAVWGCWSVIRILHRRNLLMITQIEKFGYGIFIVGAGMTT